MSFDAYKVAVLLTLKSDVGAGLSAISGQLGKTGKEVDMLQAKLHALGKMFTTGAMVAGAGAGMLFSLKGPFEQAMEWERQSGKLRQMGLGDQQIAEAKKFVTATDIIGSSMQERMKLFTEAQGAFRESGMNGDKALEAAKTMMPVLANYAVAVKTLSGGKKEVAESSMMSLNRLVEQMGGLNSPARAAQIVDAAFRSVQASGKMISPEQLRQFRTYGSSAVSNYSDQAIFASLEPIIGELKGSTTGTGLRTASNRMHGVVMPPHQMLNEVLRLGIWDKNAMEFNSLGGIKSMKRDPLTASLAHLMDTDPGKFAKVLMGIYQSHGITTLEARARENTLLFGSNGAKVFDLMMRQMPVLERSVEAFENSKGILETNKNNANGPLMAIEKFHAALSDLGLTIGQSVLPVLTPFITGFTDLLRTLSKMHVVVPVLAVGFTALAAALAFGGTVTMLTSGMKLLGVALQFAGVGGAGGAVGIRAVAAAIGGGGAGTLVAGLIALGATVGLLGYALNKIAPNHMNGDIDPESGNVWVGGNGRGGSGGHWENPSHRGQHLVKTGRFSSHWEQDSDSNVRPGAGAPVVVNVHNKVDAKGLATMVTREQDRELSRPQSGISTFDGRMSLRPPVAGGH